MLIKATANQASITQEIANLKDGDTLYVSGGTVVLPNAFAAPFKANNAKLICDGDVTVRMITRPLLHSTKAPDVLVKRIAAMVALGMSGDVRKLDPAQMAAVNARIADTTKPALDWLAVANACNAFMATLEPLTDARIFGANLQSNGVVTINGLTIQFGVGWGASVSKGIINATGIQQVIENFTWENARQGGSSYNGSGIYCNGIGLIVRRNTFRDCEDGFRSSDMLVPNPSGEWYFQHLSGGRADLFGYVADLFCTYDNCGAGGNAHGRYCSQTLWNLSAFAHVIRTYNGNALKFHGDGLSVAYAALVEDATDTAGLLQAIDFDCGPAYAINNTVTKATAGGGNYQAPILFRNDREPIASWSEPRAVAMGNVVTYLLSHNNVGFIRGLNATAYFGDGQGHDMWPGTPVPMTGIVRSNVFRCAPLAGKIQTQVPANFDVGDNVLIDLNAPIPDKRVPMPDFAFSDTSVLQDFATIVATADPAAEAKWLPKLRAAKVFPPGYAAPSPAPAPQPAPQPAPTPTPAPVPGPTPEEIDMGLYQDRALAAEAEVTRLEGLVSQMQLDAIAAATKFKAAMDQKDQALSSETTRAAKAESAIAAYNAGEDGLRKFGVAG